ncbi:MAG: hypothetical protein ACLTMW_05950 [Blautia hydrogenotrophica]
MDEGIIGDSQEYNLHWEPDCPSPEVAVGRLNTQSKEAERSLGLTASQGCQGKSGFFVVVNEGISSCVDEIARKSNFLERTRLRLPIKLLRKGFISPGEAHGCLLLRVIWEMIPVIVFASGLYESARFKDWKDYTGQ